MKKIFILLFLTSCAYSNTGTNGMNGRIPNNEYQNSLYNFDCPFGGQWVGSSIGRCPGVTDRILGQVLGSAINATVGAPLNDNELSYSQPYIINSLEYLQTGYTQYWNNPNTNSNNSITIIRTINNCREFQIRFEIQSQLYEQRNTACRNSNSWQIAN